MTACVTIHEKRYNYVFYTWHVLYILCIEILFQALENTAYDNTFSISVMFPPSLFLLPFSLSWER